MRTRLYGAVPVFVGGFVIAGMGGALFGHGDELAGRIVIALGMLVAVIGILDCADALFRKPALAAIGRLPHVRVEWPSKGRASSNLREARTVHNSLRRVPSDGLDWILDGWELWPNGEKEMKLRGVCAQHGLEVLHRDIRGNVEPPSTVQRLRLGGFFCPGSSGGETHDVQLTESSSWVDALSLARVRMKRELEDNPGD